MSNRIPFKKTSVVIIASVLSAALTVGLLLALLLGTPPAPQVQQGAQLAITRQFARTVTNSLSDALRELPDEVVAIEIPKEYWLSDEDLVAPEPDPNAYGRTTDPKDLTEVIAAAEELLDGQSLVFTTDVTIAEDSEIVWYLDETILVITWKEMHDHKEYTFSEVKIHHPSQFRRFLSGGEYGSGVLYTATEMAASVNAVTASSADYYAYRPFGNTVYNGTVMRWGDTLLDTCYVDANSDLIFVENAELYKKEDIEAFVRENDIRFSLAFGPILLRDGELATGYYYGIGEVEKAYSRAALCQQGPLHYVTVTANYGGANIVRFAQVLQSKGIMDAYALDGGQTATIVTGDTLMNRVDYGGERQISDIIYFATAIPDGG